MSFRDCESSDGMPGEADFRSVLRNRAQAYRDQSKAAQRLARLAAREESPIGELGLDFALEGRLEAAGVSSVRQLVRMRRQHLLALPEIGQSSADKILLAVRRWRKGYRPPDPPLPENPVFYQPGSEAKLRAMMDRAERGEALFHPADGDGVGRPTELQRFRNRRKAVV